MLLGTNPPSPLVVSHRRLNALAAPRYHCGACNTHWLILGPQPRTCECGQGPLARYQVCIHAVDLTVECGQC